MCAPSALWEFPGSWETWQTIKVSAKVAMKVLPVNQKMSKLQSAEPVGRRLRTMENEAPDPIKNSIESSGEFL
jgi:hypothetical protein